MGGKLGFSSSASGENEKKEGAFGRELWRVGLQDFHVTEAPEGSVHQAAQAVPLHLQRAQGVQAVERQALHAADPVPAQLPAAHTQGQEECSQYALCKHARTHARSRTTFFIIIRYSLFQRVLQKRTGSLNKCERMFPIAMCKCLNLKSNNVCKHFLCNP